MLFLDRQDVIALLPIADCIAAVEKAFASHANGELPAAPGVLGSHVAAGGFHVKTAALGSDPGYFAAKINANFPGTGVFPVGPQVVTCYTCHRGDTHPVSLSNRRYELPAAKP